MLITASEAKQVQNKRTVPLTFVRLNSGGDDSNVIGANGGAVLGGFLGKHYRRRYGSFTGDRGRRGGRWRSGRMSRAQMNKTRGVKLENFKDDGNTHYGCAETRKYAFLGRSACRAGQQRSRVTVSTLKPKLYVWSHGWPSHAPQRTSIVRVIP